MCLIIRAISLIASLCSQALDVDLVPFLLGLLDGKLDRTEQAGRSKALVVKALKSMSQSTLYGSQVSAILNKSPVWTNYSQQNHDLFISNTPQQAYLPGKYSCFLTSSLYQLVEIYFEMEKTRILKCSLILSR